jgi:hypothetical protein
MQEESEKISLSNSKGGAAVEMFDRAFDQALKNIGDPNTDAKAKRVITLQVTLQATEDRAIVGLSIACTPKLIGQRTITTSGLFQHGKFIENKPKQLDIFNNIRKIGGNE